MDFYRIRTNTVKDRIYAYPDWQVDYFEDLMLRGGAFYAVWDESRGMWSTDELDLRRLVDEELAIFVEEANDVIDPMLTRSFKSGSWRMFNDYIRNMPRNANYHPLDETLTFANQTVTKHDYVSKRLPYSLEEGKTDAWDELLGVLYSPEERDKIEWAIGAVVSGDSRWIQKFMVFYGPPASGKSTIINIIERLFEGYVTAFEAKSLIGRNSSFGMEPFVNNPLVAVQHDGDLSRIEDNTKLNSIVGHDVMSMNIKYRSAFAMRLNSFLFMGTNKPVRITDAKAGNTRRLIDIHPTGAKIVPQRYHILMEMINYELGPIAHKCLRRYLEMGQFYYDNYIPVKMMLLTDTFYNFIESHYDIFRSQDRVQLKYVWDLYKLYCDEANISHRLQYHEVRDELNSYFAEFKDQDFVDDKHLRSVYYGFKGLKRQIEEFVPDNSYVIELQDYHPDHHDSAFNIMYPDQPAQLARPNGSPGRKWNRVETTLKDIDVMETHYVKVPEHHIVIDYDLCDEDGEKDLGLNISEASKMPPTYTELSRSGNGIHLHYIYTGDVHQLSNQLAPGIEIKTLLGDGSLRRKLTVCNTLGVATISSGLPKKEGKVLEGKSIQSERSLRELIERNLRKEIHPGTKPSIDFIHHILKEAYDSGLSYDLTDMRRPILAFAAKSTNQAAACIKIVQNMEFVGKNGMAEPSDEGKPLLFFDVEVYPNLVVVCWKAQGSPGVVRMINPEPMDIEPLFQQRLVGFNNRRYDNHILWAIYMGYSIDAIYKLSHKIIEGDQNVLFGEAYNLSYADIYDFSSKKQGLKKFELDLGIHHLEIDLPWDQPVPEKKWIKVVEYCVNDVVATEAVFESRIQDFVARQILASLSGLSVNHTTLSHTAKIIFGDDKYPQRHFVYTDLSEEFPGYVFDGKESTYCDEVTGEGGYVYSEPGFYGNVTVLDVASMHPASIERLNLFGPYTANFSALKEARLAIKRKDYEYARTLADGKLGQFLVDVENDPEAGEALSYALKIVINIVYGLTSAHFDNPFRDRRNRDNIVAKRGALFMINLRHAVQDRGYNVVHIKTDSIKIPNADPEIIEFIVQFGKDYGYEFELETIYDRFCLINDAVYVARSDGRWTAVGAQFQHPVVFKRLFTGEDLEFDDFCEVKHVTQGSIYLDMDGTDDVTKMRHVGRTGSFVPVKYDGGHLWRIKDGKQYHVSGTKGYFWVDREVALYRDEYADDLHLDMDYFEHLVNNARKMIEKYVSLEELVG